MVALLKECCEQISRRLGHGGTAQPGRYPR